MTLRLWRRFHVAPGVVAALLFALCGCGGTGATSTTSLNVFSVSPSGFFAGQRGVEFSRSFPIAQAGTYTVTTGLASTCASSYSEFLVADDASRVPVDSNPGHVYLHAGNWEVQFSDSGVLACLSAVTVTQP